MIPKHQLYSARILIIDDNPHNVDLLQKLIAGAGYSSVLCITDPRQAESLYIAYQPDLVLLDINMPYLDGYQVMEQFKKIDDSYIPVLVLTALQDEATRIRALKEGAQDFLTKPFNKLEILTRIRNMISVRILHTQVKNQNIILEQKVQERTIELQETRLEIIRRLGRAAEYRDNETGRHILRMSKMAALLGSLAGMTEHEADMLLNTSPMHDIGKIGIPDIILLKPGKLNAEEWEIMKTHTVIGANLLDGHDSGLMVSARDIALTHHEKWDGYGYPRGLKGKDIPLAGRICSLADVFDALTSKRPYKDPYPVTKAYEIIKAERGRQFDPELTDLFFKHLEEFIAIKEEMSDPEDFAYHDYQLSERDKAF